MESLGAKLKRFWLKAMEAFYFFQLDKCESCPWIGSKAVKGWLRSCPYFSAWPISGWWTWGMWCCTNSGGLRHRVCDVPVRKKYTTCWASPDFACRIFHTEACCFGPFIRWLRRLLALEWSPDQEKKALPHVSFSVKAALLFSSYNPADPIRGSLGGFLGGFLVAEDLLQLCSMALL